MPDAIKEMIGGALMVGVTILNTQKIAFVASPFPAARPRSRCRIEEELLYGAYLAMQDGARAGARHLLRLFAVVALR